jgi:hypothetical protein
MEKEEQMTLLTVKEATRKEPKLSHNYDPVTRPAHYNMGGVECIDYIKQVLGLDGFIAYCHGNMIKYQHRYRYKKSPVEDMEKAQWYLEKMLETMKEKHK